MGKIIKVSRKPKIIKSDLETIRISLIYPCVYNKEKSFYDNIIKQIIQTSCASASNDIDFYNELDKRLIVNYSVGYLSHGSNSFLRCELEIPKPGVIPNFDIERAFEFFVECLYKPFVDELGFNEDKFEREKEYLIKKLEINSNDVYRYSSNQFFKYFDVDNYFGQNIDIKMDELKNSNRIEAYEIYKEQIVNNKFLTFVLGDIYSKVIDDLFKKYLPIDTEFIDIEKKYFENVKISKKKYFEESAPYNQSALYMNLFINNMLESEYDYAKTFYCILFCRGNNLLFNKLRTENNIIYSLFSSNYTYNGVFILETYIDEANKDLAIKLVKETIAELKDKDKLTQYIKRLKKSIYIDLIRALDSLYNPLEKEIYKTLELKSLKDFYDFLKKVDIDEFILFLNKVEVKNIYFMKGTKND